MKNPVYINTQFPTLEAVASVYDYDSEELRIEANMLALLYCVWIKELKTG